VRIEETTLAGVCLIEPDVYRDERGFFLESYNRDRYREVGLDEVFVQDNHSYSHRGTLRGLHAQSVKPQGKLVRTIEGEIFDVAVDIRVGSPTFAHWVGQTLTASSFLQLYIPPGFAHGFCVLSPTAQVEYKCTELYDAEDELVIGWDDPEIGIDWPLAELVMSERDRAAPRLAVIMDRLPRYDAT